MDKTVTQQQFDGLVAHIWAYFKPLGYRKKGNNFRFYDRENEWGKIVNFQKSQWGSKDNIRFTVNIGLYLAECEFYALNKKSGDNFTEPVCAIRNRIGLITDYKTDKWYDLNESVDIEKLRETIERNFTQFVIPYLNKFTTKEDIFLSLSSPNYGTSAIGVINFGIIKALFYNGYKKQAFNLIEHHLTERKFTADFLQKLEEIKKELLAVK